jgi:hypothetical protein
MKLQIVWVINLVNFILDALIHNLEVIKQHFHALLEYLKGKPFFCLITNAYLENFLVTLLLDLSNIKEIKALCCVNLLK